MHQLGPVDPASIPIQRSGHAQAARPRPAPRAPMPRLPRTPSAPAPRLTRTPSAPAPRLPLTPMRPLRPAPAHCCRLRVPACCRSPACACPRAHARLPALRAPYCLPCLPARAQLPLRVPAAPSAPAQRPTVPCVAATVTILWLSWALYCNTVQPCLAPFSQYSSIVLQYNLS